MTELFETEKKAILMGCYYATGVLEKAPDLKYIGTQTISQFGYTDEVKIYELTNCHGELVRMGV